LAVVGDGEDEDFSCPSVVAEERGRRSGEDRSVSLGIGGG